MDIAGPEVTLEGADFANIFSRMDENARVPQGRVSLEQTVQDGEVETVRILSEISRLVPYGPPMQQKKLLRLLSQFIDLHAIDKALPNGRELVGKERSPDNILGRLKDFMTWVLLRSVKMDKSGNYILDKKGNRRYMALGGLREVRKHLVTILKFFPEPAISLANVARMKGDLKSHFHVLRLMYSLTRPLRTVTVIYAIDVKRMIEAAFIIWKGRPDIAVQACCLLLFFLYLGARPGSLLRTLHWPDDFIRWSAVELVPVRDSSGKILGFDTKITVSSFKGYHAGEDLRITFLIRAVILPGNMILDIGTFLLAHAIRRGALPFKTLDEINAYQGMSIKCSPEFEDKPIFVSRKSRTSVSKDPMTDGAGNSYLKALMRATGIASGKAFEDTLYALRRGFASTMVRNMSLNAAKFFLGHRPDGTSVETTYDQSNLQTNLGEGVLGPGERQERLVTPMILLAAKSTGAPPKKVNLGEALARNPEYQHLKTKQAYLLACQNSSSTAWRRIEPYCTMPELPYMNQAHLPILISRYAYRLRQVKTKVEKQDFGNEMELQQAERDELDWQTVQTRRDEADKPSKLGIDLYNRMLSLERHIALTDIGAHGDAPAEVVVEPMADEVDEEDLEVDEDDEEGNEQAVAEGDGQDVDLDLERDVDEAREELDMDETDETTPHQIDDATRQSIARVESLAETDPSNAAAEPASSVNTELSDLVGQRSQLLCALVDMVDDSTSRPCRPCQDDKTVTVEAKARLWKEGFAKVRHDIQFHSPFPFSSRWLKYHTDDKRFNCPFDELETHEDQPSRARPCGWSQSKKTDLVKAYAHVSDDHPHVFSPDIMRAFDPDTRMTTRAEVGIILAETLDLKRWKSNVQTINYADKAYTEAFFQPGAQRPSDYGAEYMQEVGLGPSVFHDLLINTQTDRIPEGLLDSDGLLVDL